MENETMELTEIEEIEGVEEDTEETRTGVNELGILAAGIAIGALTRELIYGGKAAVGFARRTWRERKARKSKQKDIVDTDYAEIKDEPTVEKDENSDD